jgi:tyrosinase
MGSDGTYIPHAGLDLASPPPSTSHIVLDAGTGSGCVFSGPFVNYSVNLGPLGVPNETPVSPELAYNPRCLKRDLTTSTTKKFCSFQNTTELILNHDEIFTFQTTMDGDPRVASNAGTSGVHGGGHFSVAGDPGKEGCCPSLIPLHTHFRSGADFQVSPGDPYFFLHHGQIDRVYSLWQNLDLSKRPYRQSALWGTRTFIDSPPSDNGTLDDLLDLGPLGPPLKIRDAMSTVSGPFCSRYA